MAWGSRSQDPHLGVQESPPNLKETAWGVRSQDSHLEDMALGVQEPPSHLEETAWGPGVSPYRAHVCNWPGTEVLGDPARPAPPARSPVLTRAVGGLVHRTRGHCRPGGLRAPCPNPES